MEDRRGSGGPRGGGGRRRAGLAGGTAGLLIVVGLIAYGALSGNDVSGVLDALIGDAQVSTGGGTSPAANDEAAAFASVILADTEDTWQAIFQGRGQSYAAPTLVLFRDRVQSACGIQGAATGPFYCPGDRKAYIDLSFFEELHRRFGAPGDMAQAYVLAHEIGHHIQTLTGVGRGGAQTPTAEA